VTQSTIVGYPRIGGGRELKRATERYWDGRVTREELLETGAALRLEAWERMRNAGIDLIPSNTFSYYDQVLDTTALVGAVPERYGWEANSGTIDLDLYFAMARGEQDATRDVTAMEMTKWFDTNYHYIVPEFSPDQRFALTSTKSLDEYREAREAGIETVPVLLGPISYLLLGKVHGADGEVDHDFHRLSLLEALLPVYEELLGRLAEAGAVWVQIDEPTLVQDRTREELTALGATLGRLAAASGDTKLLVQTYFGDVDAAYHTLLDAPIDGIGLDLARGQRNLDLMRRHGARGKYLAAGVVDGRNVWINDLGASRGTLEELRDIVGADRLLVSTSCSLMHVPIELDREDELDDELRSWLAFANQKIDEVATLTRALEGDDESTVAATFAANEAALESRRTAERTNNPAIRARLLATGADDYSRPGSVPARQSAQQARLGLPRFPTTTIGSFPQTPELRRARRAHNRNEISTEEYETEIEAEIERVIRLQEEIGLDVLVHGEPERNDMVEYFGEQLDGFAFTRFGWVQSYGSRYVKPPIVFGDVSRPAPMTVRWSTYAQSLTDRPVKGMLTGPVTILNWSFVRDDQPRAETCRQIALAIRDEVVDLEAAGIGVIQIDEPALREGLPLRQSDWTAYLAWSVACFRLAASGVRDETQIHTHMCYAEFNDIIEAISDLDADVISIENSRSDAELLEVFHDFEYDKGIGLGVYDIHSPRIPPTEEMAHRLEQALDRISERLIWVNPDCGLKTRRYEETLPSLEHLVAAASQLRERSSVTV
jgi:5-methyltetrahydropteroyltriglutamate--homocysteine methyltransferase